MSCVICKHPLRAEIENALLSISSENKDINLGSIAKEYKVTANDLKVHALMHSSMGMTSEEIPTIARQLKLKEADILAAVVNEYMVTLKTVGRRIQVLSKDGAFEKFVTKAIVDLYLGAGSEIRASVKTLAELNNILKGPDSGSASGLHALAEALKGSRNDTVD